MWLQTEVKTELNRKPMTVYNVCQEDIQCIEKNINVLPVFSRLAPSGNQSNLSSRVSASTR